MFWQPELDIVCVASAAQGRQRLEAEKIERLRRLEQWLGKVVPPDARKSLEQETREAVDCIWWHGRGFQRIMGRLDRTLEPTGRALCAFLNFNGKCQWYRQFLVPWGRAHIQNCLIVALLQGAIPGEPPNHYEELMKAVDAFHADPVGNPVPGNRVGDVMLAWFRFAGRNARRGNKEDWYQGVVGWMDLFPCLHPDVHDWDPELAFARDLETKRVSAAKTVQPTSIKHRYVGLVSSTQNGFDVWLADFPVIVRFNSDAPGSITIRIRSRQFAAWLLDPGGLRNIADLLDIERWSFGESWADSPPGVKFSHEQARKLATTLANCVKEHKWWSDPPPVTPQPHIQDVWDV